jgi:DNA invertase Pin-like site-specific DNA recombinase
MNIKCIPYARVSTGKQELTRQINDLKKFAETKNFVIHDFVTEIVSGSKRNQDREGILQLISILKQQQIKHVLVSELSRLGRTPLEVITLIEQLNQMKVSVHIQDYNLVTLNSKGEKDPLCDFLIYILSQVSRMEKEQLIYRIKSGITKARTQGKRIGRQKGEHLSDSELLKKHITIVNDLRKGISIRKVAKIYAVSPTTVKKVKKLLPELQ